MTDNLEAELEAWSDLYPELLEAVRERNRLRQEIERVRKAETWGEIEAALFTEPAQPDERGEDALTEDYVLDHVDYFRIYNRVHAHFFVSGYNNALQRPCPRCAEYRERVETLEAVADRWMQRFLAADSRIRVLEDALRQCSRQLDMRAVKNIVDRALPHAEQSEAGEDAGGGECSECGGSGVLDGYPEDDPPQPGCGEPCPACCDDEDSGGGCPECGGSGITPRHDTDPETGEELEIGNGPCHSCRDDTPPQRRDVLVVRLDRICSHLPDDAWELLREDHSVLREALSTPPAPRVPEIASPVAARSPTPARPTCRRTHENLEM